LATDYKTFSNEKELIDSPFVKLAQYIDSRAEILGMPPIPLTSNISKSNLYSQAVKVLDLNNEDKAYVACKIRHLDFAARQSALANQITWKSSTADAWTQAPIFDQPTGSKVANLTGNIQVTPLKQYNVSLPPLNWTFLISGNGSNFSITGSKNYVQSFSINNGQSTVVTLSNSGYSVFIRNFLTSGQTASCRVEIAWPYVGDLIPIKNKIIAATDLLTQLATTYPDITKYCQQYSAPEDTIAAFLIAVDSV
jgi:hypothetical protein